MATGSDDHTLRLWEAQDRTTAARCAPRVEVAEVLTFSPDGRRLAAGCSGSVVVYELAGRLRRQLQKHGHYITALAVRPRRPVLASASRRNEVSLEDVTTGQQLHDWRFTGIVGKVAFSPDGNVLAVAPYARAGNATSLSESSKDIYLLETETGKVRKRISGDFGACHCLRLFRSGFLPRGTITER